MGGKSRQKSTIFFSKPPQSITQLANIPFPTLTDNLHHRLSLLFFENLNAQYIASQASQHIFGYAVGVDLTKRDIQAAAKNARKPWDLSKGFDNSAPISKIQKKKDCF